MYICSVMLLYNVAKVKMGISMICMAAAKVSKPRVIVEVTEDEKADLDALSFVLGKPTAQIVRGLVKSEIAKHRAAVDQAKRLAARGK